MTPAELLRMLRRAPSAYDVVERWERIERAARALLEGYDYARATNVPLAPMLPALMGNLRSALEATVGPSSPAPGGEPPPGG